MKPENRFIQNVHKHIGSLYAEKMHNPYRGGTADVWYSGRRRDMWVEYKYLPTTPSRGIVTIDVSPLQTLWLQNRFTEGRHVAVIVGCPDGGVILSGVSWLTPLHAMDFRKQLQSVVRIGEFLLDNNDYPPAEVSHRLKITEFARVRRADAGVRGS